jgi:hypothetical protein
MKSEAVSADMLRSLIKALPGVAGGIQTLNGHRPASISPLTKILTGKSPPETEGEIQRLQSALAFLSPHVPRGQGHLYEPGESEPSNNHWLMVVWAIASLGWSCGEDIARDWSQQSPRYSDDGFDDAWRGFDPSRQDAIGIGSLYKLAKTKGWQSPPSPTTPVAANDERYRLLNVGEIESLPHMQWLIKGVLPKSGLVALYGPSGSGKSFLALELAACIAAGREWFGMRVKQAPVVYVMLEGEGAIRNRIAALKVAHGALPNSGFSAVVQAFTLTTPRDVTDLVAVVPRDSVLFIDTLNRAAPTSDENSSREMGLILQGAKELQASIGGLVVLIHHTGKDQSKGMRGHSSLHAALDGAIEVERTVTGTRHWSVAKAKDGEDGKKVAFKLKRHVLGNDPDGDEISSCSVEPDHSAIFAKPEPTGKQQKLALKAIKTALAGAEATTGKSCCPAGVRCMEVDTAVEAVASGLTTTAPNKRRNAARQIISTLIAGGYVNSRLDTDEKAWCWLE